MNRQRRKALILTPRIFPGHQIASLLEQHGWTSLNIHNAMPLPEIMQQRPGMLVVDVTSNQAHNLDLLDHHRHSNFLTYRVALCEGSNTLAMRIARHLGVDGFFYLNRYGQAIDPCRGLAPVFLQRRYATASAQCKTNMPTTSCTVTSLP